MSTLYERELLFSKESHRLALEPAIGYGMPFLQHFQLAQDFVRKGVAASKLPVAASEDCARWIIA